MRKSFYAGLATVLFITALPELSPAAGLIITGVIDGPLSGGTPKAVELYALEDIGNLSIYGLGFANNGEGSDGLEFAFPALSAHAGDFFYIASETEQFVNFFGFAPDAATGKANINGDDAVELFRDNSVVDVFGTVFKDGTGQPWEYLDGWAYRNDGTGGGDSSAFHPADWFFSGPDSLDAAQANLTAEYPFPVGSFLPASGPKTIPTPEPASLLLLASGLAGLAAGKGKRRGRQNK